MDLVGMQFSYSFNWWEALINPPMLKLIGIVGGLCFALLVALFFWNLSRRPTKD